MPGINSDEHRQLMADSEVLADTAAHSHGMGQEDAIATIARWLDLRAGLRVGAGRAENLAVADLLRTGDWLEELEELSQCRL